MRIIFLLLLFLYIEQLHSAYRPAIPTSQQPVSPLFSLVQKVYNPLVYCSQLTGTLHLPYITQCTIGDPIDTSALLNVGGCVQATQFTIISDARFKALFSPLEPFSCLERIIQLRPVLYSYSKDAQKHAGFIAQEVAAVIPEAVTISNTKEQVHSIDYTVIITQLVGALQACNNRISELQLQVEQLRSTIEKLKKDNS